MFQVGFNGTDDRVGSGYPYGENHPGKLPVFPSPRVIPFTIMIAMLADQPGNRFPSLSTH